MDVHKWKEQLRDIKERAKQGEDISVISETLYSSIPDSPPLEESEMLKAQFLKEHLLFVCSLPSVDDTEFSSLISSFEQKLVSPQNMEQLNEQAQRLISDVSSLEAETKILEEEIERIKKKTEFLQSIDVLLEDLLARA